MADIGNLKQKLQSAIGRVNFTKVNGEQRSMLCTLLPGYIPADEVTEPTTATPGRTISPNALSVWDIEKNGWRAFRYDSIESVDCPVADTTKL